MIFHFVKNSHSWESTRTFGEKTRISNKQIFVRIIVIFGTFKQSVELIHQLCLVLAIGNSEQINDQRRSGRLKDKNVKLELPSFSTNRQQFTKSSQMVITLPSSQY